MESSCQIRALSGILVIVYKKQKKYKRVMEMLDRLELKAYGKINLGLDVVRKRERPESRSREFSLFVRIEVGN